MPLEAIKIRELQLLEADASKIELGDQGWGGNVAVEPFLNAIGDRSVQLSRQRIDRALAILKGKIADQRASYQDENHEWHRQNDP